MRCREIWCTEFPSESFENEVSSDSEDDSVVVVGDGLLRDVVEKRRLLCSVFAEPYRSEVVYLIAARQRYKAFLYVAQRFGREPCSSASRLVPTSDILLMWLTHQVCFDFDFLTLILFCFLFCFCVFFPVV